MKIAVVVTVEEEPPFECTVGGVDKEMQTEGWRGAELRANMQLDKSVQLSKDCRGVPSSAVRGERHALRDQRRGIRQYTRRDNADD